MSETCPACRPMESHSRWKKFGAWVGVVFFCPCHLPVTIAGMLVLLSATGVPIAESWGRPLVYGVFVLSFLFFVIVLIRMAARRRDRERHMEDEHALHSAPMPAMTTSHSPPVEEANP